MAGIRMQVDSRNAIRAINKITRALTPEGQDRVVAKAAYVIHRRLVSNTPKKWTGQTRRGWHVHRNRIANYSVTNKSKVMGYLERGTRAHGPVTAKRLFIPLNRKTALAGPANVAQANHDSGLEASAMGVSAPPKPFKIGKDFILAKRVRGIKPLHLVRDYTPFAKTTLKSMMRLHIRNILAS